MPTRMAFYKLMRRHEAAGTGFRGGLAPTFDSAWEEIKEEDRAEETILVRMPRKLYQAKVAGIRNVEVVE